MSEKQKKLIFYKYASLFVLILQTTACVLVLRYSKKFYPKSYLNSTAVLISEVFKLIICSFILFFKQGNFKSWLDIIKNEIIKKPKDTFLLIIPAALYTIQNNLLFLALTNLNAATFQVTYQLKILITALFSVAMLNKKLSLKQWISLIFLMIGVIMVQWPKDVNKQNKENANNLIGLTAVILSCFSSGFSGVFFEKLVKFTSQSLWIRNLQLCIFATLLSSLTVIIKDFNVILEDGFFQGYNNLTWYVICLQAFGGLLVAVVMKYADNILKGFATSISIILSTLFSYYLLNDFIPSFNYLIGSSIVITSTILYSV